MTLAYSDLVAGTPVTWTSSGGDKVLTFNIKTTATACEGAKSASWVDGTKGMPEIIEVRVETKLATAATNGKEIEVYVGESDNSTAGTDNPGSLQGADGIVANPDQVLQQCTFIGAVALSNARGTNTQKERFWFNPVCPYTIPVLYNLSGQTTSLTGTDHKVVMTPYYRRTPVA